MAWSFVQSYNSTTNKAVGTADTATVSASFGDTLIALCTTDNVSAQTAISSTAVTDSSSNTWTRIAHSENSGTSGSFMASAIFVCQVDSALSSGTVTFAPANAASHGAKAFTVYRFTGGSSQVRATTQTSNSAVTSVGYTHTGVQSGDLVIGVLGQERTPAEQLPTYDSDTSNGSWSGGVLHGTTGGSSATNNRVLSQYKIASATASQTWNVSWASTTDTAGFLVALAPRGAKVDTLTDAFASYNSGTWDESFGTPTATSNELHLSCVSSYELIQRSTLYDFTETEYVVKAVSVPTGGNGTRQAVMQIFIDSSNYVEFGHVDANTMYARQVVGGSATTDETVGAYNSTNHLWWKIQHDVVSGIGYLSYWTSANGTSWTQHGSGHTSNLNLFEAKVRIMAGYYGTETSPPDFVIDNLNTAPTGTDAPAGEVTAAASASAASTALRPSAGQPTASVTANAATVTTSTPTNAPAGHVPVSVAAAAPAAAVRPVAGQPSATAVANGATVAMRPNAGTVTAAGAPAAAASLARPVLATVSGATAANAPSTAIRFDSGTTAASGVAYGATVSTAASTNAQAGHAAASAAVTAPATALTTLTTTVSAASAANSATTDLDDSRGDAGEVSASAAAIQPSTAVRANAGTVSAAAAASAATADLDDTRGDAEAVSTSTSAHAGSAALGAPLTPLTASVAAFAPTVSSVSATDAPAGSATATVVAEGITPAVRGNLGTVTGSAVAYGATVTTLSDGAGLAAATATAEGPAAVVSSRAVAPGATATAYGATVSTAAQTNAPAGHASAAATANGAETDQSFSTGTSAATATAYGATVSTASIKNAPAGESPAAAEAYGAMVRVSFGAGTATASVDTDDARAVLAAAAAIVNAAATALDATNTSSTSAAAGHAAVSAVANAAGVNGTSSGEAEADGASSAVTAYNAYAVANRTAPPERTLIIQ